jgi:hypothetical protein
MSNFHKIICKARDSDVIDDTIAYMRTQEIFDFMHFVVSVEDGSLFFYHQDSFCYWINSRVNYFEQDSRTNPPTLKFINPKLKWIKQILSLKSLRKLKPLEGVITAPIINLEGDLISKHGYDPKSRLYFDTSLTNDYPFDIKSKPTENELEDALNVLMTPFGEFSFCSVLDESVLLAAVLTAIMRPILSVCPGFAFDAPTPGEGKTYLAQTIAYFMLAKPSDMQLMAEDDARGDEELRKRLLGVLKSNKPCFILDNIKKTVDSKSLSSLTSSEYYSDRVLNESGSETNEVKTLILLTGNNLNFSKDLDRRFAKCRLDSKTEHLQARVFNGDPHQYVKANRFALIEAGLTLIMGWLSELEQRQGENWAKRTIPSYSGDWDRFVGQTVAWIADQPWSHQNSKKRFCDVAEAFSGMSSLPEDEVLFNCLKALYDTFGNKPFTAKDILDATASDKKPELIKAFDEMGIKTPFNSVSIGKLLAARKGQLVNGLSIESLPKKRKISVWKVEKTLTTINHDSFKESA